MKSVITNGKEFAIVPIEEYNKLIEVYNWNETRKVRARKHQNEKYKQIKEERNRKKLADQDLTFEEVQFILDHTS